jgi:hypothetical protein
MMKVEMLRMKMEGMSKGMHERMAEYSRRLEVVAAGDNAGCRSRKCGNQHSRKASASSQRSWSGGSNASTANVHDSFALNSQSVVAEKHHRQQKVHVHSSSNFQILSLTVSILLAISGRMIRIQQFAVSLGRPNIVDLGARLVSDSTPLVTDTNPRLARPDFVSSRTRRITRVNFEIPDVMGQLDTAVPWGSLVQGLPLGFVGS